MASERAVGVCGGEADEGKQEAVTRYYLRLFQYGRGVLSTIDHGLVEHVEDCIEKLGPRSGKESVDVWLESLGGDAHAAYKLVLVLRERFSSIRVVVPYCAKSAATLLALGGERIFLAPSAELGPIDAQVQHPEKERERLSALDIARSLESLSDTAVNIVITGGGQLFAITEIERTESVEAMLRYAADFMAPIVAKLDPSLIHRATRQLDTGRDYACRLLAWHLLHGQSFVQLDRAQQEDVRSVAARFVEDYPAHEFVIALDELEAFGLNVSPISEYEYAGLVVREAKKIRRQRGVAVDLLTTEDIHKMENPNESASQVQETEKGNGG